jgi:hypothetical protein
VRRGLLALGVFAAFIVAVLLFRGGPSDVEVTAFPDGAWETANCGAISDGFGLSEARERCLASGGDARFQLTVENGTEGAVAVTSCTVVATGSDGASVGEGPIVVPVRAVYGVPYTAAYLRPGDAVTMQWFVPGAAPSEDLRFEGTCEWSPFSGPLPL